MAEPSSEEQKPWDAAQCEAALGHLARLQEQLDSLRATIPSLVAPLSQSGIDKALLFAEIKGAAVTSTANLHAFRDDWSSEETQSILKKAKDSLSKDENLNKAASVPRWGWDKDGEK